MGWYLEGEILSPLHEMFLMMHDFDAGLGSPMGTAGRIGDVMVDNVRDRILDVFQLLKKQVGVFELVIATNETPGVPKGKLLAIDFEPVKSK